MKQEHKHPGTNPPSRTYSCIHCSHLKTIKGVWNTFTGRWLMAFNCDSCGTHQEAFVSEPRTEKPKANEAPNRDDID